MLSIVVLFTWLFYKSCIIISRVVFETKEFLCVFSLQSLKIVIGLILLSFVSDENLGKIFLFNDNRDVSMNGLREFLARFCLIGLKVPL